MEAAKALGLCPRIMGACAVRIHSPEHGKLLSSMTRPLSDIDLMAYKKETSDIRKLLIQEGYVQQHAWFYGGQRSVFEKAGAPHVDVFYDKLDMCHTIEFKGRLELDFPTITVSDILLEKMQIVHINEKDLKDSLVLFLEHPIEKNSDQEAFNSSYIAGLLSNDWGFYYTVTTNLGKVKEYAAAQNSPTQDAKEKVAREITRLAEEIENVPKTSSWKFRARVGTKRKWYKDVEEVVR